MNRQSLNDLPRALTVHSIAKQINFTKYIAQVSATFCLSNQKHIIIQKSETDPKIKNI